MLDFSDEEFGEIDEVMEGEEADLERNVNLPSNMDSKLWRIKVKPGMERQLVMRLTNKLISHLNNGNPPSSVSSHCAPSPRTVCTTPCLTM